MFWKRMTCRDLVETVTAWLEGTLPPDERARFDSHLARCPECRTYVEQMRLTIRLTGQLDVDNLSAPEQATLLELFRGWRATRP